MLLDIHTHRRAAVPGEYILSVEPARFEPVDGCYYSVGIHPWKVSEAAPEDWEKLEKELKMRTQKKEQGRHININCWLTV